MREHTFDYIKISTLISIDTRHSIQVYHCFQMWSQLIITVLLSVNVAELQLSDSLYDFSTQHQLQRYRMRVDILHNQLLTQECLTAAEPDVLLPAEKRELLGAEAEQELEVEKILFIKLRDMLISVRSQNWRLCQLPLRRQQDLNQLLNQQR